MSAWGSLSPVAKMMVIVYALLLAASILLFFLKLMHPNKDFAELRARTASWWVMASLFFLSVLISEKVSLIFFALLSFWGLKEYVTLLKSRPADHRALALAFLSIPIQYYWVWIHWYGMFIVFVPVYMFLLIPLRLVLSEEPSGFVMSASEIQWGLMAFVFGLSHLGFLRTLAPLAKSGADGRSLLLFLVFVVELSDVLQYVWGKSLGRHKILPHISPNKTWEGFMGGVLSASALAVGLHFLTPFTAAQTFGVALLITVCGFFGGAVMSAIKRDFGVKDFGSVIPGHGGVLDRVDSLCYAAPVFFHFIRYFYY